MFPVIFFVADKRGDDDGIWCCGCCGCECMQKEQESNEICAEKNTRTHPRRIPHDDDDDINLETETRRDSNTISCCSCPCPFRRSVTLDNIPLSPLRSLRPPRPHPSDPRVPYPRIAGPPAPSAHTDGESGRENKDCGVVGGKSYDYYKKERRRPPLLPSKTVVVPPSSTPLISSSSMLESKSSSIACLQDAKFICKEKLLRTFPNKLTPSGVRILYLCDVTASSDTKTGIILQYLRSFPLL